MTTGRLQALMIAHAGLVLLLGMIAGFPFLFHLIGEIRVWPLPIALAIQIPGSEQGWRAAHVGNILNGTMLLAVAAAFHRVTLSPGLRKAVAWSLIATVWGNAIFYVFSAAFTTGRGLSFGTNRFGGGDWFNSIAYVSALAAVFTIIFALAQVVRGALASARAATGD